LTLLLIIGIFAGYYGKLAKTLQKYWEERNREHFARIAAMPPKPGPEAVWAKLQAQKARHESKA
jgi:hypothetical protein